MSMVKRSKVQDLNNMNPAASYADLGTTLDDVIKAHNALAVKLNALLAKLDLDAGVTDTNFVATIGTSNAVVEIESR